MFITGVFARRIVVWVCATTMRAEELPLQVPEQAISWAAGRGGVDASSTAAATGRSTSASYAPRE